MHDMPLLTPPEATALSLDATPNQRSDDDLLADAEVHSVVHPMFLGSWAKNVCQEDYMEAVMDALDTGTCV
jgi:hypothetical protein